MTVALRVEVLLFARLRERAGTRALAVTLPDAATAADAWAAACAARPALDPARPGLRVAVNERYCAWDEPLRDGDVVAVIPPVAGGSGATRIHVRIGAELLDARECERTVRTDADGAVCTFSGVVRDHHEGRAVDHLEYEAYAAMAEAEMRRIGAEALERGATAIALWHRVGRLGVGEVSVVVVASAHHRAEAFDACRHAIDTLKARAPIWKKEHGPGGEVWVEEGGSGGAP